LTLGELKGDALSPSPLIHREGVSAGPLTPTDSPCEVRGGNASKKNEASHLRMASQRKR